MPDDDRAPAEANEDSGRGGDTRGSRGDKGGRHAGSRGGGGGSGRSLLLEFLDKTVSVVTNDGRVVVGRLRGFDQVSNVIMDKCVERVFTEDAGVEAIDHGVYVLRGDNIAAVGEVDAARDSTINWGDVKVGPVRMIGPCGQEAIVVLFAEYLLTFLTGLVLTFFIFFFMYTRDAVQTA